MDKEINAKIQVRNEYGEVVSAQEVFIDSRNLEKFGYVKVVRCKDCKFYGCIRSDCCQRIETSDPSSAIMQPNDFCSYGERREDNND